MKLPFLLVRSSSLTISYGSMYYIGVLCILSFEPNILALNVFDVFLPPDFQMAGRLVKILLQPPVPGGTPSSGELPTCPSSALARGLADTEGWTST